MGQVPFARRLDIEHENPIQQVGRRIDRSVFHLPRVAAGHGASTQCVGHFDR